MQCPLIIIPTLPLRARIPDVCSHISSVQQNLRWRLLLSAQCLFVTMQRAIALARRLPALSSLRAKAARGLEQPHRMPSTGSLLQHRVYPSHMQELRYFHSSSSAFAKNLNFNFADIGEGIAEVCFSSFPNFCVRLRTEKSCRIRLSCFSGL